MILTNTEKKKLLLLSRNTLDEYFVAGKKIEVDEKEVPAHFLEKRATFVTLIVDGQLHGCIGNILPKFQLYKDVVNNTLSAAFSDPRFPQLTYKEMKRLKIEISILTVPKRIMFDDIPDLLKKIKTDYGIILQAGFFQATFLPDVWKDFPKKEDFLINLSLKAGLSPNAWKNEGVEYFLYKTENFSE